MDLPRESQNPSKVWMLYGALVLYIGAVLGLGVLKHTMRVATQEPKVEQTRAPSPGPSVVMVPPARIASPDAERPEPVPEAKDRKPSGAKAAPKVTKAPDRPAKKPPTTPAPKPATQTPPVKPPGKSPDKPAKEAPRPAAAQTPTESAPERTIARPKPPAEKPAMIFVDSSQPKGKAVSLARAWAQAQKRRAGGTIDVRDAKATINGPVRCNRSMTLRGAYPYGTWLIVNPALFKQAAAKPGAKGQPGAGKKAPAAVTILQADARLTLRRIHFWLDPTIVPDRQVTLVGVRGADATLDDCSFTAGSASRVVAVSATHTARREFTGMNLVVRRCAFRGVDAVSVRGRVSRLSMEMNLAIGCNTFLQIAPFKQLKDVRVALKHNTVVSDGTLVSVANHGGSGGKPMPVKIWPDGNVVCGLTRPMPSVVRLGADALLKEKRVVWAEGRNRIGPVAHFCHVAGKKQDWAQARKSGLVRSGASPAQADVLDPKAPPVTFNGVSVRTMQDRSRLGSPSIYLCLPQAWALSEASAGGAADQGKEDGNGAGKPGFDPKYVWLPSKDPSVPPPKGPSSP